MKAGGPAPDNPKRIPAARAPAWWTRRATRVVNRMGLAGLPRRAGGGEHEPDRRPLARRTLRLHPPALGLHQMLHDGEPQPGAPLVARAAGIGAVEPLEDAGEVLGRDAAARVEIG